MTLDSYLIFLITTFVVVLSPGPAAITVASQGASNGFFKSVFGVFGVASANVIYFILSATGIAALIVASNMLFSLIKWCGVVYLIYLGIKLIIKKNNDIVINNPEKNRNTKLFTSGLLVELANPKALIYFAALLPSFIDINEPILLQITIMGVSCFIIDLVIYSIYGYLGSVLSRKPAKAWLVNLLNKTVGSILIFAGTKMAFVTMES